MLFDYSEKFQTLLTVIQYNMLPSSNLYGEMLKLLHLIFKQTIYTICTNIIQYTEECARQS
jgi:hypothetical protein